MRKIGTRDPVVAQHVSLLAGLLVPKVGMSEAIITSRTSPRQLPGYGQLGNNAPSSPRLPEACAIHIAIHNSAAHAGASTDLQCRPRSCIPLTVTAEAIRSLRRVQRWQAYAEQCTSSLRNGIQSNCLFGTNRTPATTCRQNSLLIPQEAVAFCQAPDLGPPLNGQRVPCEGLTAVRIDGQKRMVVDRRIGNINALRRRAPHS